MRADLRMLVLPALCALSSAAGSRALAQQAQAEDPVLRAHSLRAGSPVKMFVPSGTVRLIGWDRDSILIRGQLPGSAQMMFGGSDTAGYKLVIEQRDDTPTAGSRLTIYLPRRSQVSLKTADASTEGADVGGWFYTVSGSYHIAGTMSSADAESMSGDIDLDATTPWARMKTGKGHLVIRGSPADVDASTISGVLDIAAATILHGRFTSVTGDIHYASTMRDRSLFEFSTHSGAVDFLLPRDVSARFELSSVEGVIDNGFEQLRPAAAGVHTLRLNLGTGAADVTVRTFKGTVRLRARP